MLMKVMSCEIQLLTNFNFLEIDVQEIIRRMTITGIHSISKRSQCVFVKTRSHR